MLEVYQFGFYEWDKLRWLVQDRHGVCLTPNIPDDFLTCQLRGKDCPHQVSAKKHEGLKTPRKTLIENSLPKLKHRIIFWENLGLESANVMTSLARAYNPPQLKNAVQPAWGLAKTPDKNFGCTNLMPFFIYSINASNAPVINNYIEASYATGRSLILAGSTDACLRGVTKYTNEVIKDKDLENLDLLVENEIYNWLKE